VPIHPAFFSALNIAKMQLPREAITKFVSENSNGSVVVSALGWDGKQVELRNETRQATA
jgi:hypothetical protein